jgi:hypothetical protein
MSHDLAGDFSNSYSSIFSTAYQTPITTIKCGLNLGAEGEFDQTGTIILPENLPYRWPSDFSNRIGTALDGL